MDGGPGLEQPKGAGGRVAVWFAMRYATAPIALAALAISDATVDSDRLAAVLTAHATLVLLTHSVASRGGLGTKLGVWLGMTLDMLLVGSLVASTGGVAGPLVFLFTLHATAAGILLSSRAGIRVLGLSTVAIVMIDVTAAASSAGGAGLPRALQSIAALWVIGGGATLFSVYNESELRRRNAELATIRRVTLDIEQTLSIEEIFADLCDGVVRGFRLDVAAVLLREGEQMRVAAMRGQGGAETCVPLSGRLKHVLTTGEPVVVTGAEAIADGALIPILRHAGYLAVPIADDGLLVVTRRGRKGRPGTLRASEVEALDRLAHHARLAVGNARLHARVAEMAITDPLSGLANHGEMQRRLADETARIQRFSSLRGTQHSLSIVLLDIDHFKRFNDRFGHPAGDTVIRGVADAIRGAVRDVDLVSRYGGEEFAVMLPETPVSTAREIAERIRSAVAAYPFAIASSHKPVRVTVSVGVATAPANGSQPAALIEAADAALYRAKDEGRNRVCHADDAPARVARVVPIDATRRRQAAAARPGHAGSRRAPSQSSRPKRRTPRA